MAGDEETPKGMRIAGRLASGLVIAFLVLDGAVKMVPIAPVTETLAALGYPSDAAMARLLGLLTLAATVLYAVPRTACLGAIVLTGYLGGAMATHLRVGSPAFSHTLFGLYLGVMIWGGLWLRDARLHALLPIRRPTSSGGSG
ncbi:DoxX family protein [Ensifer soli]|uniref:DoxX family protein n=1 Tax=Ciceribacter sp. sgz301302 TaxID=3342379 RepID=UPI0035B892F7